MTRWHGCGTQAGLASICVRRCTFASRRRTASARTPTPAASGKSGRDPPTGRRIRITRRTGQRGLPRGDQNPVHDSASYEGMAGLNPLVGWARSATSSTGSRISNEPRSLPARSCTSRRSDGWTLTPRTYCAGSSRATGYRYATPVSGGDGSAPSGWGVRLGGDVLSPEGSLPCPHLMCLWPDTVAAFYAERAGAIRSADTRKTWGTPTPSSSAATLRVLAEMSGRSAAGGSSSSAVR